MRTLFLIIVCLVALTAQAQKKIDHEYFQKILASGDHARVFREATQLRNEVYGKCEFLDY